MPCGCSQNCGCEVVAGTPNLTVVRVGDTFTISASDPSLVQSVDDTNCINLNVDGSGELTASLIIGPVTTPVSLACSGAGLIGDLIIDPTSTAPISSGPAGLKVDCCAGATFIDSTNDTDTIALTVALGLLTASVIPNASAGLENQAGGVSIKLQDDPAPIASTCGNRLRFNVAGDLTELQDGIQISSIPAGASVNLSATEGAAGSISSSVLFTNNDTCPVYVLFEGIGIIDSASNAGAVNDRVMAQQMRLRATLPTGGAVDVGGAGLAASSDYGYHSGAASTIPADKSWRFQSSLEKWVYMPAGSTITMVADTVALENVVGWTTTVAAGGSFMIDNYKYAVFPQRIGGWLVS